VNPPDDVPPEKRDSLNSGAIVALLVIFGLILYVLSPVIIALNYPSGSPPKPLRQILKTFFTPLKWLYENVEIVRSFYDFMSEWVENTFL